MASSLGQELNAATRPLHTTLNRLILTHLPLALPPYTSTPLIYAHGLSAFLPIYATFESLFKHILASPSTTPRMRTLLSTLHMPTLERVHRLQADLARLSPDRPLDGGLEAERPSLHEFVKHIEQEVEKRPHLLVAYTWNMYMALFSGGRYLRTQLRDANAASWNIYDSNPSDDGWGNVDAPLQFWNFVGDADGEDLKADFKARVATLECTLTSEERAEIVAEGVEIMRGLIQVVRELEEMGAATETETPIESGRSYYNRLLVAPTEMLTSFSWGIARRFGLGRCPPDVAAVPLA